MSTGDSLDHVVKRGYVKTTDGSNTNLVTVDLSHLSSINDALIFIRGWAYGLNDTAIKGTFSRVLGLAGIVSGAFSLINTNTTGEFDGGSYGVDIVSPGATTYALQVSGGAGENVFWQGRIEVEVTEL